MEHPLNSLIDRIVQNAERRGELDNLPGAGKPLTTEGNPKDAVLNRLMTQSRVKPPAVALQEKITEAKQRLQSLEDPDARKAEMKVLSDLQLRLALELEGMRKYG